MDHRCRLALLGTSSTASVSSNNAETVDKATTIRLLGFIFSCLLYFFQFSLISDCLFPLFLPFVLLLCHCFHVQVFGRILLYQFHIFYSHTKWNLPFSLWKQWSVMEAKCCQIESPNWS